MTAAELLSALSTPCALGTLPLPNRFAMAPMTRRGCLDGVPGAAVAAYYARRAAADVGLIISEAILVDHPSAGKEGGVPALHTPAQRAGWRAVTEAVHQAGGRIVAQLWHVGMVRTAGQLPNPGAPAVGPSGVDLRGVRRGRAMTPDDLDAVCEAFARTAASARQAGFDGVEVHGAHGYLIDQFLWERTNQRADGYGGNPRSRARFGAEVVSAVRRVVGPEHPIVFRFSQWKATDYDARIADSPTELEAVLRPLREAGVDAFHASTRRYRDPAFEGSPLTLAGWAKKITGAPAIAVGSVGMTTDFLHPGDGRRAESDLTALSRMVRSGAIDLVALGRTLLADPEWVSKSLSGRQAEIRPYREEMRRVPR